MMDRALKERIIGAAVLVLVVVLVVPVFLDGPPQSDEMVSRPVPLPGQAEQQSQTVVLDRDRDEPVPATAAVVPAEVEPQAQPEPQVQAAPAEAVVEEPRQNPVAAAPAAVPEVSATGMWAVQLGSFGNQENAERLAAELRKQGFAAFLSKLTTSNGELHRVRVGPQKDRESADEMAARLRNAGHDVKVLPHP